MAVTWYSFFRFLHVLSAVFIAAPHLVLSIMARYIRKNPESAPTVLPLVEKAIIVPGIGGTMMLVTGLVMIGVNSAWSSLRELWLAGSLVILVFTIVQVNVKIHPALKALAGAIKGGPVNEVKQLSGRLESALIVEAIALVVIVILMILKPTL